MSNDNRIISTPEWDALHAFDAENGVEPFRTTAARIAGEFGFNDMHSIVDHIAHALEDAMEVGARRGPFELAAIASYRAMGIFPLQGNDEPPQSPATHTHS